MKNKLTIIILTLSIFYNAQSQTAFTPGNIAVLRIAGVNGTNGKAGTSGPGTSGVPVHIDEYSVAAGVFTFVRTIDLPASPSLTPLNNAALDSVFMSSSTNEGFLTLSGDGKWLSFFGYDSVSLTGTIYSTTNNPNLGRTVGLIKYDGTYNIHTKLSNFPVSGTSATPSNAITTNGTDLWVTTSQSVAAGVIYTQTGATNAAASPSVIVSSTNASNRTLGIWGTDLYYVTASSKRIGMVSATGGIPMASGNVMTDLTFAGAVLPSGFSPNQMVLFDMDVTVPGFDVMYVTNSLLTAATPFGIYKYSKDINGTWNYNGGFDAAIATNGIYYGITGSVTGGIATLIASRGVTATASLATNQVVQIVDASGFNATMNGTITATLSNSATLAGTLRGVALVPTVTGTSATLPLTLQNFTGSLINNNAQLSWLTNNEVNVKEFIVERALNATEFSAIGRVAANNTNAQNNYSYTDAFATGNVYYRLKIVDNDGSYKYSNIVTVSFVRSQFSKLTISPNPAKDVVTISHIEAANNAVIKIVSITGKLINTYNVAKGAIQTSFNITSLTPGEYVVYYNNNGSISSTKMVK